jgi:hypothetical protein
VVPSFEAVNSAGKEMDSRASDVIAVLREREK